jgi:hypothetical protein
MQRIRRHLTYANVMVTALAFIVMGGTAWALANNSVGTKQLKNKAVTAKKIGNGAVTGPKIAKGAVTGSSVNVSVTQTDVPQIPAFLNAVGGATATCPAGKKAIAGGGLSDPANNGGHIEDSRPVNGTSAATTQGGTFTGWRVVWQNTPTGPMNMLNALNPRVYVICLG